MSDTPQDPRHRRRQQAIIWSVGLVVTAVMLTLGLWQMSVFRSQGKDHLVDRMSLPAIPLTDAVNTEEIPKDAYGRPLEATGTYLPGQDILVPDTKDANRCRVLSPLRLQDGTLVPVVRGVSRTCTAPEVPIEQRTEVGVFLPSEGESGTDLGDGKLATVRLPLVAQQWDGALMPGYLNLVAAGSQSHGLEHAEVVLPSNAGNARSSGYALQWWIFAAATMAATVKLSRDAAHQKGFMAPKEPVEDTVEE
ncbi:SURF1 family protein [Mariniluteicoccus endophyticus]